MIIDRFRKTPEGFIEKLYIYRSGEQNVSLLKNTHRDIYFFKLIYLVMIPDNYTNTR